LVTWSDEILKKLHIEEVSGIPLKVYSNRPQNLTETLEESVRRFADKEVFITDSTSMTYREFQQRVHNVAYQLKRRFNLEKGDRIGILLVNSVEFAICAYAAAQLGAIGVILNTKLKAKELQYMLENSGARVLVSNPQWWGHIESVRSAIPCEAFFITGEDVPEGTFPFSELDSPKAPAVEKTEVNEHDPIFIMYTSGTTGLPKGAVMTHFNFVHTILNYVNCLEFKETDRTLITIPMFTISGLAAQLATFIYLGASCVLMPQYDKREMLRLVEKKQVTHIMGSPTVYMMALAEEDYQSFDWRSMRRIVYGGSPMPTDVIETLKKWLPQVVLTNAYGLTETTSPTTLLPMGYQLTRKETVGIAVPNGECRVVDPQTGKDCSPGEAGELVVRGPFVIPGYWRNEEATRKSFRDGWFHTGDMASMDEEGFIVIQDRIKDMINRGGDKIFSAEVENVLYQHPKILEAAIVGVPDPVYGEAVKAVVVCRNGQSMTDEELLDYLKPRLAKYKLPKYIEFTDQLPRNPGGKVVKHLLRSI